MSAGQHSLALPATAREMTGARQATEPIVWADWSRRYHWREWMRQVRGQRVDVLVDPPLAANKMVTHRRWTRAELAHWRLSWTERLARNARSPTAACVNITVFGLPSAFAAFLGLSIV